MEKSKVRVAHVLHSVGGVDVSVRLIVNNLNSNLFENTIIHGKHDTLEPFLNNKGLAVAEFRTNIIRNISLFQDVKSILDTIRYLKKNPHDLIHAHSAKGGVIGKIAGMFLGIKTIYTPQAFSYLSSQNKIKRFLFLCIERMLANKNGILLASSGSEQQRALTEVKYSPQNTAVFANCIEPIQTIFPLTINKTWADEYICTVGRPSYQKNIEMMIQAVYEIRKTHPIHLVVMGVGHHVGQLESVKNLIKKLDLSTAVTLLDWTARTDVFNIISQSKFYLSTARYEGMPYSVIESLSLSKPCVVTDCDGNKDLIQDGYNGYVVNQDDLAGFVEKVNVLLSNADLCKTMSIQALQSFNEHYNIKNNIQKLESIYTLSV
jgi:glycosyltransferase involved in cell wall biosynthesis